MYLIRNKDGSIKKAYTDEFVNQGSNNANYIDMALIDTDIGKWTADCFFELPNGDTVQLAGTQKQFSVDGVTYNGYRVYLSSAVLTYAGILKAVARTYNASKVMIYSYPFKIMVNATTLDSTYDAPITEAQYNSFMSLLASYLNAYDTHLIRKYDTLGHALDDINDIRESEHVIVSDGENDYKMYYKAKATDTFLTSVPPPTNWSEIWDYTGLSKSDLSTLKVATLKGYIDKYDVKEVKNTLLTGVLTTTLTLKDTTALAGNVSLNDLYYTKEEVYSKEDADKAFISSKALEDYLKVEDAKKEYLKIESAKETYLSKEDASSTYLSKEGASEIYLNKEDASSTYETKVDATKKHSEQDLAILTAQNKADSAYALASGKAKVHIFDTYDAMKKALKEDDGTGFNEGDSINIRAKKTPDYWISKKLDTNTGEFGYYEILEDESNLSDYQTIEDNTLETTHKTIVGAINENKANIETKQSKTDNSLNTTSKTIVGAINENKTSISTLDTNKQNKSDNSLNTTSKTIVGAINENKTNIGNLDTSKQNKSDTSLETTNKTIVGAINELKAKDTSLESAIDEKQGKTDVSLKTTSKEVVGAINELKTNIETNATNITEVENKIPTKVSQLTNDKNYIDNSVANLVNYYTITQVNSKLSDKANISDIPTKVSKLENDAGYITNAVANLINYYDKNTVDDKLNAKANPSDIPTKTSQLTNDSGYITKSVGNLENYTTTATMNALLDEKANVTAIPSKLSELLNDEEFITANVNNLKYYMLTTDINSALASKITKDDIPTKLSAFANDTNYITKNVSGLTNYTDTDTLTSLLANKITKDDIPTNVSDFTNDAGYIKNSVSNLTNYYDKTTTDSKLNDKANTSAIPTKLSQLENDGNYVKFTDFMSADKAGVAYAIPTTDVTNLANVYIKNGVLYAKANPTPVLQIVKVDTLPTVGELATIYLVPISGSSELQNKYKEYIYFNDAWEEFGETKVDLSDYATIEYVDGKFATLNTKFDSYYTITQVDSKLGSKLDATANAILNTLGTNAVQKATKDSVGNVINTTYATKSEVETSLSDKLNTSEFTATGINTALGTTAVNKANKDGSGNVIAETYATKNELASDLGTKLNVSEFTATGIISKIGTNAVDRATKDASGNTITTTYATKTALESGLNDKVDKADFTSDGIVELIADTPVNRATSDASGNNIIETYATINALDTKFDEDNFTATNIVNTLGTTSVKRAIADKNGNDITTTYATNSSLSSKMNSADFTATNIVSKLGTTAVNRATADASGNTITSTYATKAELKSKVDNTSTAIINTIGSNAVQKATKAVQDENGNNIASTYQRSAFIVKGSVATTGVITFTSLTISDLLSAINNNQRIVFVPSDTSLASIDLNAQKTADSTYTLKGSFSANVSSNITNYSCVINVTSTTSSGTYTSQTAKDGNAVDLTSAQTISGSKTFTGANKFSSETTFTNATYCPTWADIANGIGKSSCFTRGAFMQLFTGQIMVPNAAYSESAKGYNTESGKLKIQTYTVSSGQPTSPVDIATFSANGLVVAGSITMNGKSVATTDIATTTSNGLMSSSDKTKLNGIAEGANKYTLPTASTSTLGGVKVDGSTITITNGVIKVAQSGQQTISLLDTFPTI